MGDTPMKKLFVLLFVAMLFILSAIPAFACGPNDNWTCEAQSAIAGWSQAGQYTKVAADWAIGQAGGYVNQGAQNWNSGNGGPWTLPSGASQPLQAGYDQFTNYASSYGK
jgi:hypothetical protein